MSPTTDKLLNQSRADATTEGRVVLALEAIADQIKLMVSLLAHRDSVYDTGDRAPDTPATDRWDNEGGRLPPDYGLPEGIERHTEETFAVGKYRYTNLADAVAQVRRSKGQAGS